MMADCIQPTSLLVMRRTWESEVDSCATKGAAVNRNRSSLSLPFRVVPSPSISKFQTCPSESYLLAATVPHSCVPQTHAKIDILKNAHFLLVLSSAPRSEQHRDCSFLSCSGSCLYVHQLDDDCFYYHSWRNNLVVEFGTLSSFLI